MNEVSRLKQIVRDLTCKGDGGKWYAAYRGDVEVDNQEAIQKIWDEEDCGCGLGDKCPDPPRPGITESVAENLLREIFDGKVEVALAGNPITCARIEDRIRAFFDWKGGSE